MKKNVVLLLVVLAVMCFARPAVPAFAAAPTPSDWLGEWAFTFESGSVLVRFDDVCETPNCPQGTMWKYIAHGQKSDGSPIQIRKVNFAGFDTTSYYYDLSDAEITVCGQNCPNAQIPDANYNNANKTFTVSAYFGDPPNRLVSGAKDIDCVDADLDGYGTGCNAGADCNDGNPAINPGVSDATCNGIDENCSGAADEGYVPDSSCFLPGACATGNVASSCSGGTETPCATGTPTSDANCDGIDNDCSGTADEDYVSQLTSCGVGACAATGSTSCVAGGIVDSCTPGPQTGVAESICNGVDDDCDGTADENYVSQVTNCGVGACAAAGSTSCVSGGVVDSCTPGPQTGVAESICNGVDDDCDSATDEGYVTDSSCFLPGACAAGNSASTCVAGVETGCATGTPVAEIPCNGIDDNCDGATDEGSGTTITYYLDADNDTFGNAAITQLGSDCFPIPGYVTDNTDCADDNASINPDAEEICSGKDNDCDGVIDDGFESQFHLFYRDADADGYGQSATVIPACAAPPGYVDNSTGFDCNDSNAAIHPGVSDVICDGIDDDCDGTSDDGYVADSSCFLPGACSAGNAASTCVAGVETGCATGSPTGVAESICNGIDDDCDGSADEGYVANSGCFLPGVCAAGNAASTCIAGSETACQTGTPSGIAESVCNGADDDCDSTTDEDYAADSSCFLPGVCAAGNAASTCVAGVETGCAPGTPTGIAESICNGIDDDCDGTDDEDYVSQVTNCGVGACATTGSTSCVSGGVVDSCTPGTSTAEVCNGIDDDCDGDIDNGLIFKTYYMDADYDSYGNADNATVDCEAPEGYVDNSTGFDCNDNDSAVNPEAEEVCGDGIDNNCDNLTDENCNIDNCTDADGDGYFAGEGCTPADCDDTDWKNFEGCEASPCSLQIIPKQIFKVARFFEPVVPFIIIADTESGIEFGTFTVRFASDAIRGLSRVRIGQRIIVGAYLVNPFKLEKGDTTAEVEIYGVSPDFRCATFTVR